MTIYTTKLEPIAWSQISLPIAPKKLSIDKSIQKIAKQAFDTFSRAWNYAGKAILLARHMLNIIIRTPAWIASGYIHADNCIRNTITKLKLFTIVGVILDVGSLPSKINTIWTNIQWKDKEGILLSTLSFTVMIADMFDSVTTFVNATLNTLSLATIGWVATISNPFTFSLIGLSATLKAGNLYNLTRFFKEFDWDISKIQDKQLTSEELRSIVLPLMHKHLGKNLDPIDTEHRTEITKRRTSNKILLELKELGGMLDNAESNGTAKITNMIAQIKKSLKEEMALQAGSLLTTVIAGIASTLFLTAAATTPVPFALLAVSISLRISLLAYQEWKATQKSTPST
jgi:hypothetical protein